MQPLHPTRLLASVSSRLSAGREGAVQHAGPRLHENRGAMRDYLQQSLRQGPASGMPERVEGGLPGVRQEDCQKRKVFGQAEGGLPDCDQNCQQNLKQRSL